MSSVRRIKMCAGKVSFTNKNAALKVANKFDQTVYECPVCFCFHCTNLQNWREEFVPIAKYRALLKTHEQLLEASAKYKPEIERLGKLIHELNGTINGQKQTIKLLRKRLS